MLLQVLVAIGLASASGFYLPGVAPKDYKEGDPLNIRVNKLSSAKTWLPYDYYSLPFCKPDVVRQHRENLGEVLRGDKIESSMYTPKMKTSGSDGCVVLCPPKKLTKQMVNDFQQRIEEDYRVNMILDNLPVGQSVHMGENVNGVRRHYTRGFPIGIVVKPTPQKQGKDQGADSEPVYVLHNHLRFIINYHKPHEDKPEMRIVGFEVYPFSIQHELIAGTSPAQVKHCKPDDITKQKPLVIAEGNEVVYTYEAIFQSSSSHWAQRWDMYLTMELGPSIHWFSIINSLMIVLFLTGMVAMIMLRTLHRDITKYNQLEAAEEAQEETGWKLVHGDVFRAPPNASLLATFVGTGVQLLGMAMITSIFAALGFLSPAYRGGLLTAMLCLYIIMGSFGGYFAGQLYRAFKGDKWNRMTLNTCLVFPAFVFGIFFVLDLLVWGKHSTAAVPFVWLLLLFTMWLGVSLPLTYLGSYYGFRASPSEPPVRTNKIPRQVPEQPFYMNWVASCLIGGILPFGAVFIELYFILSSLWQHKVYYIFGFLLLVFVILLITCAEITIVLCYFQLCSENYHWWWRAYFTSGASALYLWLYSCFYFFTKVATTQLVPTLVYFGCMLLASYAFFFLTGTVGFLACYKFVHVIYSAVKID